METAFICRNMGSDHSPGNTIVFADMTGTLLMQEPGGFPDFGKAVIVEFLNQGGELNVVTGDSFPVAREHFLQPLLDYKRPEKGVLRISSLAGYRLDAYDPESGETRNLHEGTPVPQEVKNRLLDLIERQFLEHGMDIAQPVRSLKTEAGRHDVGKGFQGDGIEPPVYLEVVENKVTLFFTKNTVTDYPLFRSIVDDPAINETARQNGLQMMELYCCLDIISTCKSDAVDRILSMHGTRDREKGIVVMGDSRNDGPMFMHPFKGFAEVRGYYLGDNASYFSEICGQSRGENHWLKGRYITGAYEVLERMVSGLTC